ncbi:cysteine desulfurase [Candidatus Woesearchaeota archaeon]|nr:cysteine desulfurase [Candidatus Woesearchaeota archaeon]
MNPSALKKQFPIFKRKIHGKSLTYLDNAATTQKPQAVIDTITDYYTNHNANIHRGVYQLSQEATGLYEAAHATIGRFIGASADEIIFTRNTTESINLLAHSLPPLFGKRNELLLTELEHHANLVPWQQLAKRAGMQLKFIRMNSDFTLDLADAEKKITSKTALVALCHVSNALGTINPVQKITQLAKAKGALTVVDAAQSVPHMPVDVKRLGCDFLAFSGHKMYGSTGIGVLYGRKELLERMPPYMTGGDMIKRVSYHDAEWNDLPMKFEAGTPHISGAIGLAAAVSYLQKIGMENIRKHEEHLTALALEQLKKFSVTIYHPGINHGAGIISFNLRGVHAHDVASLMDDHGICIRGGHHCAMPLMKKLGIPGTARISFGLYNTEQDVAAVMIALQSIIKKFGVKV